MRRNRLLLVVAALPIALSGCSDRPSVTEPAARPRLTQTQTAAGAEIPSGGATATTQNTTPASTCGPADNTGYLGSGFDVCVPPTP
jgi:hypothetical protein